MSGGRVQRHVEDVDARAPERQRDLGHDARPVGHGDAQLVHVAAREVGLEQAPALLPGALVPGRHRVAVAGRERTADLGQAAHGVVDGVHQRVGVGEVDVAPDRRVGPRHARGVAERGAGGREPLALVGEHARRARHEHVGQHVREVGDGREQRVVGVGVERRGARAEVLEQPVQALVEHPAGALGGRQVPGGAVEQVRPGVGDARGLGAGQRVAADEARIVDGRHHRALRRAHVGDDAVLPRRVQHLAHGGRQVAHRGGHERRLGAVQGRVEGAARLAHRAALDRGGEHPVAGVEAPHVSAQPLARGQADRAADQAHADDGQAWAVTHQVGPRVRR